MEREEGNGAQKGSTLDEIDRLAKALTERLNELLMEETAPPQQVAYPHHERRSHPRGA